MVDDNKKKFNPNVPTLKQVRETLGMSQGEFASALGITRETINRYEQGRHRIRFSIPQVRRLAELMEQAGMSVFDLPDDIDQ